MKKAFTTLAALLVVGIAAAWLYHARFGETARSLRFLRSLSKDQIRGVWIHETVYEPYRELTQPQVKDLLPLLGQARRPKPPCYTVLEWGGLKIETDSGTRSFAIVLPRDREDQAFLSPGLANILIPDLYATLKQWHVSAITLNHRVTNLTTQEISNVHVRQGYGGFEHYNSLDRIPPGASAVLYPETEASEWRRAPLKLTWDSDESHVFETDTLQGTTQEHGLLCFIVNAPSNVTVALETSDEGIPTR